MLFDQMSEIGKFGRWWRMDLNHIRTTNSSVISLIRSGVLDEFWLGFHRSIELHRFLHPAHRGLPDTRQRVRVDESEVLD
jgi:hypothetical protein